MSISSERYERVRQTFNAVKRGDWQSVARLKQSARAGDVEAQATLELLYADERKNHQGVLVLREGITTIAAEQFKSCGLRSLVLPAALRKIGKAAFQSPTIPSSK